MFLFKDKINFDSLQEQLLVAKKVLDVPVVEFLDDNVLFIQSKKFLNGVPLFLIKVSENLKFENYHAGARVYIPSLTKNRITILDSWSILDEILRYLNTLEIDNMKTVVHEHFNCMTNTKVGKSMYSNEIIIRSFEYFATSRALYKRMRKD